MSVADAPAADVPLLNQQGKGYRGVWYQNQRLGGEYVFKYSGGLGTYCAKHRPFAVYRPEVNKTFFCYGGVDEAYHTRHFDFLSKSNIDRKRSDDAIHHMVSYYDHGTGEVPRPTVLLNKQTHDAHDNPVISVDDDGYIWIFSTAHGTLRDAFVHRSTKPYDIGAFERVRPYRKVKGRKTTITNFSYMQAWHIPGEGFVQFFTWYKDGRSAYFAFSKDGTEWSWVNISSIQHGHYQISAANATKAATSFNYHPNEFNGQKGKSGLNWRTNLYYMETKDRGRTWLSADGTQLTVPLRDRTNPALVRDFESEGLLVYMKDIAFDSDGHPLILFITSRGYALGPENDPRTWRLARWTGRKWIISEITTSDNNYDMGPLHTEDGGVLRVLAPTEPGPQPHNPGGEIAMWLSRDGGQSWKKERQMTAKSEYNHTYVRRPVNAHPDFYGFWADGHGRKPSPSRLYFCNKAGDVFRLPESMKKNTQAPDRVP